MRIEIITPEGLVHTLITLVAAHPPEAIIVAAVVTSLALGLLILSRRSTDPTDAGHISHWG